MKQVLLFLGLVFSTLVIYGQIEVPFTATPKEIDGQFNDWNLNRNSQFFTVHQKNPYSTNRVYLNTAWDDQYFYAVYRVYDQHFTITTQEVKSGDIYRNDAVEFYIDPLNDTKRRFDINDYQFIIDIRGEYVILKGEIEKIKDPLNTVPKEIGTATIAFKYKVRTVGEMNSFQEKDSLFIVEIALPWAALGIYPRSGYDFKADFCNNDADSTSLVCSSIKGVNDYGYPDNWVSVKLVGGPNLLQRFMKNKPGVLILLLIILFSVVIILLLIKHYLMRRQLKSIPQRADLQNAPFIEILENQDSPACKKPDSRKVQRESQKNKELISALKEYVRKNLDQKITAEDLAKKSGYTLRHIQRIFKEELNTTPKTFILLIKMEEAAHLLKNANKSVSEAATETGFSDPSYFIRVFKKYFNKAPTEFNEESLKN